MALKTLSAIALLLATTTANALAIDPQAPCASPAPDLYGALLNVRSGPGSQFPIVNQLRPGDIVAMLPELSGNWQHIAVYEGDGWAFRPYLQVVACPPPPPALDAPASPVAPPEGIQSAPLEDIPPLGLPFAPRRLHLRPSALHQALCCRRLIGTGPGIPSQRRIRCRRRTIGRPQAIQRAWVLVRSAMRGRKARGRCRSLVAPGGIAERRRCCAREAALLASTVSRP